MSFLALQPVHFIRSAKGGEHHPFSLQVRFHEDFIRGRWAGRLPSVRRAVKAMAMRGSAIDAVALKHHAYRIITEKTFSNPPDGEPSPNCGKNLNSLRAGPMNHYGSCGRD
ncbi:MAG TPA: hypothetical protein VNT99_03310 [Methylomirabilota bacterium]|nr:hypothetical protein [Methylomirabilota bacterium]